MLSDTTYKLKDSVKVMHDTLEISNNIEIELTNQTDTMKRDKEKLIDMQDDIKISSTKIRAIMVRVAKHKFILIITLAIIAIIVIIALSIRFGRSSEQKQSD
jgi:t-SNARE complex subunit (syntaxin)